MAEADLILHQAQACVCGRHVLLRRAESHHRLEGILVRVIADDRRHADSPPRSDIGFNQIGGFGQGCVDSLFGYVQLSGQGLGYIRFSFF